MEKVTQGIFDGAQDAEEFINETLEIASKKNLTVNDVKLALKIVESVVERSSFESKKIRLTTSTNNMVGFLFE